MEKLYRKHVLGEKEAEGGFVPLTAIAPAAAPAEERRSRQLRRLIMNWGEAGTSLSFSASKLPLHIRFFPRQS